MHNGCQLSISTHFIIFQNSIAGSKMTMMIIGEERVVPLAEMTPLEVLPNINPPPLSYE